MTLTNQVNIIKNQTLILGIDIGTSGVRGCLVSVPKDTDMSDEKYLETILYESSIAMPISQKSSVEGSSMQDPLIWTTAFETLFTALATSPYFKDVQHIVADATSSTVLLCSSQGKALTDALMYNDQQAKSQALQIKNIIDQEKCTTAATGPNSTLAKCLLLIEQLGAKQINSSRQTNVHICHQIDWFNYWLTGELGMTDENNALKLGYDSIKQAWPSWVSECLMQKSNSAGLLITLPKVHKPGEVLACISTAFSKKWTLNPKTKVHAGTTDSVAGFLASGAQHIGDGVSSLGSTLAVKLISEKPIFNVKFGVYSHRLGDQWLVGGASNSGGAVLLHYFDLDEIKQRVSILEQPRERLIWQNQDNPDYYPLSKTGERFPIANPALLARLPKRNANASDTEKNQFLLNLLQGLANVEQLCYQQLEALGAAPLKRLYSVGGGTRNRVWMAHRKMYLNTLFTQADSLDAAFGVTRLIRLFYKP